MTQERENFLSRWSRRKLEAATAPKPAVESAPPVAAAAAKLPELPPLDSLTFESDFAAFLRANVEEGVKRAALKKLFADPRFNVMDGLDVYIEDYSVNDPIPEEMLKTLEHARSTLFGPRADPTPTEEPKQEPAPQAQAGEEDGDPRQDGQAL